MAVFSPQMRATQSGLGYRKKKAPYVDMIRGQHGQATQNVLAQRQQAETDAQRAQQNKQAYDSHMLGQKRLNLQKKQDRESAKQNKIAMGLSGAKLGLNLMNRFAGPTGLDKFIGGKIGSPVSVGKSIGGGLVGAGAAQALPLNKKWQRAGAGAAIGGLASYLSGGGMGSAAGGGLIGSLGGLF